MFAVGGDIVQATVVVVVRDECEAEPTLEEVSPSDLILTGNQMGVT